MFYFHSLYAHLVKLYTTPAMSFYYTISIDIPRDPAGDLFAAKISEIALKNYQCLGVEEFSIDEPIVDNLLGDRSYSGGDLPLSVLEEVEQRTQLACKSLSFSFNDRASASEFSSDLAQITGKSLNVIEHGQQDWNEQWKKGFTRIDIKQTLSIIPSWEKSSAPLSHELFIYPGMGFGTGTHETTRLCLELLVQIPYQHIKSCLDFGCGSGILGLALKQLAPTAKIDLYDIDADAIKNTRQNIELNGFNEAQLGIYLPDSRKSIENKYELVFANILLSVLDSESAFLLERIQPGGYLIISGLLNHQVAEALEHYPLEVIEHKTLNDWSAVLLKK